MQIWSYRAKYYYYFKYFLRLSNCIHLYCFSQFQKYSCNIFLIVDLSTLIKYYSIFWYVRIFNYSILSPPGIKQSEYYHVTCYVNSCQHQCLVHFNHLSATDDQSTCRRLHIIFNEPNDHFITELWKHFIQSDTNMCQYLNCHIRFHKIHS